MPNNFFMTTPQTLTQLLSAWSDGDKAVLEQLMPMVYQELRRLAVCHLAREREGHTLQATALVNEAYLRLIDQKRVQWQNKAHFLTITAQMMRQILVDYARARRYAKRGGGAPVVSRDEAATLSAERIGFDCCQRCFKSSLCARRAKRPSRGIEVFWRPQ